MKYTEKQRRCIIQMVWQFNYGKFNSLTTTQKEKDDQKKIILGLCGVKNE